MAKKIHETRIETEQESYCLILLSKTKPTITMKPKMVQEKYLDSKQQELIHSLRKTVFLLRLNTVTIKAKITPRHLTVNQNSTGNFFVLLI